MTVITSNYMKVRDAAEALAEFRRGMDNGAWPLPNEVWREKVLAEVEYRTGRLHALLCLADVRRGDSNILRDLEPEHLEPEIEGAWRTVETGQHLAHAYVSGADWRKTKAAEWFGTEGEQA